MSPAAEERVLALVAAAGGTTPAAVRTMFGRGYVYTLSLDQAENGWRDAFGAPPS